MGLTEQRIEILQQVERGLISPEEGAILLEALERGTSLPSFEQAPAAAVESQQPEPTPEPIPTPETVDVVEQQFMTEQQIQRRRLFWLIPFLLGLYLSAQAAVWMANDYQTDKILGWGFWLSWFPLALGVGLMAMGWGMQRGCWLHVRIRQKPGSRPQKIDLSFPLPLRLGSWFIRNFGDRISGMKDKHLDEILAAVESGITPGNPVIVQVDEGDEQVEVWIECS